MDTKGMKEAIENAAEVVKIVGELRGENKALREERDFLRELLKKDLKEEKP